MAPRESLDVVGTWPGDVPVALAFEVVRQTRSGAITRPRQWLEVIAGSATVGEIVLETEAQLAGARPVDLAHWVMEDLPSHEAHFIDARSDLLEGMVLLSLYAMPPEGRPPRLSVGPTLRTHRDEVQATISRLRERSPELLQNFELSDPAERLARFKTAFDTALQVEDANEVAELIRRPIDQATAEGVLRQSLEEAWAAGFPRSVLRDAAVRRVEWKRGQPFMQIRRLELKQFFLRENLEHATIQMMGSAWARAFLEGEATSLTSKLAAAPMRDWRLRDVRARVERAFAQLSARGLPATHVVGPYSWRLWEAVADDRGTLHGPRTEGGAIATVLGVPVFESMDDLDSVFVLSLPTAIRVDQRLFDGEVFYVSVSEIDDARLEALRLQGIDDVEGTPPTAEERIKTRVDVDVRESVAFHIKREAIARVAIPPELLE